MLNTILRIQAVVVQVKVNPQDTDNGSTFVCLFGWFLNVLVNY